MTVTNPSAQELYTVVENLTDTPRFIGFLGPRGMTLGASETVAVPGDLVATLGAEAARGRRRKFDSLEAMLKDGTIFRINSRPAPVLYDPVDDVPKSIAIQNGVLGIVDPAYDTGDSENFDGV